MIKKIFTVSDMHCSMCVMRLEEIEDDLAGIKQIKASYRHQQMEVEYDPTQLSVEQIIAEVKRRGYTAVVLNK